MPVTSSSPFVHQSDPIWRRWCARLPYGCVARPATSDPRAPVPPRLAAGAGRGRSRRRRKRMRRAAAGLLRGEPARGAGLESHGLDQRRRLEHGRPAHAARGRAIREHQPERRHHGRRRGHRRRVPALLRRRDRHLRCLAADQAGGGRGLQEGRASPTARSRSPTTASRSSSIRATTGSLVSRSRSSRRSGARSRRSATGTTSTRPIPTSRCACTGPARTAGTFDFFTGADQRRGGRQPHRLLGQRGRQRHRPGRRRRPGRARLLRALVRRGERATLKLLAVDGGHGCVKPEHEDGAGRQYAPLSRPLFVYVKHRSLQRPEVKAFLDYLVDLRRRDRDRRALRPAHALAAREGPDRARRGGRRMSARAPGCRLAAADALAPPLGRGRDQGGAGRLRAGQRA